MNIIRPLISLPLLLVFWLTGCATHLPQQIGLNPPLPDITLRAEHPTDLAINLVDARAANYLIQFNNPNDAATLISPSQSPRRQFSSLFHNAFAAAGYQFGASTANTLDMQLLKLLTEVDQTTFSFEANHTIMFTVEAYNGHDKLTKTFQAKGTMTGPMQADVAAIELDLSKLIRQISAEIVNDTEIHQVFAPKAKELL